MYDTTVATKLHATSTIVPYNWYSLRAFNKDQTKNTFFFMEVFNYH